MKMDAEMTVPIKVGDQQIGEFDIRAEITVTSWGSPGTYWEPPEPCEWETGDVYVITGDNEHPVPEFLGPIVDAFLEGDDAALAISEIIMDAER